MNSVRVIRNDNHFISELDAARGQLLVVEFVTRWSGPCIAVAEAFEGLARRYDRALFLVVDVELCPDAALLHDVQSLPTFIIYKGQIPVDTVRCADMINLELLIADHYDNNEEEPQAR
ncbi:Thioredoxin-2 [Gryllus bimaculatus]|nr:Thioredoxin-2 [Gryllus bimaculatus]